MDKTDQKQRLFIKKAKAAKEEDWQILRLDLGMNTVAVHVDGPLNHCWVSGNEVAVFKAIEKGSKPKDGDTYIQEVKWGISMTGDEFMRRLTKASFEHGTDFDEPRNIYLAAQYDLVRVFELLWHIAELLFIQVSPSDHLAFNLCTWFFLQSQEAVNCARGFLENFNKDDNSVFLNDKRLDNLKCIEKSAQFWPTVLCLILQARTHEATSLLVLHSHSNSRGIRSLRQILAAMPIASKVNKENSWNDSGAVFSQAWTYWQSECSRRLSCGEFDHVGGDEVSISYVNLIANIVAGRKPIWNDQKIIDVTGGNKGWYFRFVSFVFYTDQLVVVDRMGHNLDSWFSLTADNRNSSVKLDQTVDELITSIFRLDLISFIRISSEKLSSWWLVAHFTNLISLVYPDVINDFQSDYALMQSTLKCNLPQSATTSDCKVSREVERLSLTEIFLLGYVEVLATETSILSVALGYLDYCKVSGPTYQSALLLRYGIPFSTRATNWFYQQAKSRGLHSTAKELARLASRRLLPLCSQNVPTGDSSNSTFAPVLLAGSHNCSTIGWAFLSHDYSTVNRIAQLALDRDCGFFMSNRHDQADEVESDACDLSYCAQVVQNQVAESTEVAELAAIVLGFSRGTSARPDTNDGGHVTDHSSQLEHLSPELAFLVRYAELQQCFNDSNVEGAVDRLIDLLVTSPVGLSGGGAEQHERGGGGGAGLHIPTRLRLRLLLEVRHLIGRGCLRRDQVELLIAALIELRADMDYNCEKMHDTFTELHLSLAKELAKTFVVHLNYSDDVEYDRFFNETAS